jgi:hypothetical protein
MKSEKGKPVFPDDVDAVLTDKIIEHTKRNTDGGDCEANAPSAFPPSQTDTRCGSMLKNKCVSACIFFVLILAGLIAFFFLRPKFLGMKRRKFINFFN